MVETETLNLFQWSGWRPKTHSHCRINCEKLVEGWLCSRPSILISAGTDSESDLLSPGNTDLEIFTSKLGTMCLKDRNIIRPYLLREKSLDDLAVDLGIDYRSAVKHVYRIKKR